MQKSITLLNILTIPKTVKLTLHFYFSVFTFFVLLLSSFVNAQESKTVKTDTLKTGNIKQLNSPQAEEGDVKITDGTNTLIRITDEGTFGAIEIKNGVPSSTTNKLYNDAGILKFNGSSLDGGSGATTYSVGDLAQGGYVIEVTPDGKHGLVSALQDQSTGISWYEAKDILSNEINHETSGKNYKDWRLPTKRELNLMYNQKASIGGFVETGRQYWCSLESDNSNAWTQRFSDGLQGAVPKGGYIYLVRAIRAF